MATIKKDFSRNKKKVDLSTLIYSKVPPQCIDFEDAVLSSCLNFNGRVVFELVLGIIPKVEAFYSDVNQKIFSALSRLYKSGAPIDLITVTEELRRNNELELIGGIGALMELSRISVSDGNVEYYCNMIIEKFLYRELIRINGATMAQAYDESLDCFQLIEQLGEENYKLLSANIHSEPSSLSDIVVDVLKEIEEKKKLTTQITGVPSGFRELDYKTGGWQKSDLIILAARPSIGKTAFAIHLAMVAAVNNFPVAFFSLEMGKNQIVSRMMASVADVEMHSITSPKDNISEGEERRLLSSSQALSKYKIFIDDTEGITLTELRAKARQLKTKHNIGLLIVDYLQLMSGTGEEYSREQEISKISRGLKGIAKNLQIPVIALSQLNRAAEGKGGELNRDPQLSDLRESGAIEQDADIVMFIHNPTPAMIQASGFFAGKTLITLAKGRNIGLGKVALIFNKPTQHWLDPQESEIPFKVKGEAGDINKTIESNKNDPYGMGWKAD